MIKIIPSNERHHASFGWLDTHWHFSFSDYYDPLNMHWSVLRVFNDDVIQPRGGFDLHPHRDMEIITYVIDGELTHEDSTGSKGVIRPGEVQVMSAGRGIEHSERNASADRAVHLLQLWLLPRHKGNDPRWEQKQFSPADRAGKLLPVASASGGAADGTLRIDQDATIYVSSLARGQRVSHSFARERHAYLFLISGQVRVNGQPLSIGDQARIADEPKLEISASAEAELMLLDLP